jgi:polysaccharide biosynthesis transport protein
MNDGSTGLPEDTTTANRGRIVPAAAPQVPVTRNTYGPGGYGPTIDTAPWGFGHLYEYWRILKKRKWIILGALSLCLTMGTLITLMEKPLYTTSVRVQVDRSSTKIVESGNVTPTESTGDFEFLKTTYEVLQSVTMAERVASALKLGEDADFLKPRDFSIVGWLYQATGLAGNKPEPVVNPAARTGAATGVVMRNRLVRPVAGSRLVDIVYSDPAPARAQRIANAFATAFIASSIDKRFEANAYAKTYLEDQAQQLQIRLERSEKVMLDFAEKEQIIAVNEKSSIAENNLSAANTALGTLTAERMKSEQQWKQVETTTAITLPQFMSNVAVSALRSQRGTLTTEYREKLRTFKPEYPAMQELQAKIKEIDQQLATEVKGIKQTLKGAYQAAASQEAETAKQVEKLRGEVLDLQKRSIQYNNLKRDVDTNRTLYNSLLQRFKEVDIAAGIGANNIFVIDKAALPGAPSSPKMMRALIMYLAFGLGLGLGAAFLLERLDDSIRSAEEVERITGLTTLGIIPFVDEAEMKSTMADPRSALSEAYRSLCTSLQFTTDSGLPKSLVVTSSGPSEGKSSTALTIAKHFSTIGLKVLIIDADLRKPSLHTKLEVQNGTGLSNYLTGACTIAEAMHETPFTNLVFMPTGPLPPNAADLLGGSRLLSLITQSLESFDFVVIDSPPVMGLADAQLLSSAAVATIFVVGSGQTKSGAIRAALKRLELARAPIIGSVVTKFDVKNAAYGYGYGGYGANYNNYYGTTTGTEKAKTKLTAEPS